MGRESEQRDEQRPNAAERDDDERTEKEPSSAPEHLGHTRAGSNVPNAGRDPSEDRHE